MSTDIFSFDPEYLNLSFNLQNESSSLAAVCTFQQIESLWDIIELFDQKACYRHTTPYTIFLCLANILILACGLVGNSLVIYAVVCKIKTKIASSIFMLNLAIADLFVIICCIPATLMANLFMPWVIGDAMCKAVVYGQGVSVFSSVYSLVAISFDRFRAIHPSMGLSPTMSVLQSKKLVVFIWIVGMIITLPWASVFKVVHMNPYQEHSENNNSNVVGVPLPFCLERWESKTLEHTYFVLVHVFACFLLPFCLITACIIVIWKSVLGTTPQFPEAVSSSVSHHSTPNGRSAHRIPRQRKIHLLKMFTGLTLILFVCWLPLYVIMCRVKFFYTDSYRGSSFEQKWVSMLIPAAQLLGSCNSCVNPILYALLNQKLRQTFQSIFTCPLCTFMSTYSLTPTLDQEMNSVQVIVAVPVQREQDEISAV